MNYIDLDIIKKHLNIDEDFIDDDVLLLNYAEAAQRAIENHIDQSLDNFVDDGQLDPGLQQAALLIIGTWYQNRESVTYGPAQQVPHCYEYLLNQYINYEGRNTQNPCCNPSKNNCRG